VEPVARDRGDADAGRGVVVEQLLIPVCHVLFS
jgi:hypothetical protein